MNMNRSFNFYLSLFFVLAFALAACQSATPQPTQEAQPMAQETEISPEEPVMLTFWAWNNYNDYQVKMVQRWNDTHDNVKVNLELVPWDAYHDKLLTAISAGAPPDVAETSIVWIQELNKMNGLVNLDEAVANWPGKDDIMPTIWEITKAGLDSRYAMINSYVVDTMYVNKQIFQEAGISEYPDTMDEFIEVAAKISDTNDGSSPDVYTWGMRGARGGHNQWAAMVMNDGGRFFDEQGNVVLDDPVVVEATKRYIDLFKNGYTPSTAPTDGFQEIIGNFEAGVTAMTGHNIASSSRVTEALGEENVSMIPYPKGKDGKRWAPLQINMNAVYEGTEYEKEAIEFVLWYAEAEQSDYLSREGTYPPYHESIAELPYYQENPFQKACIDSIPDADMIPNTEKMGYWTEVLWPQTFQQALLEEITAEEMIKILAEGLE